MIPRYDKNVISQIWSDENKFKTYLKVELSLLRAMEGDKVPRGTATKIEKEAKIDTKRIEEIEQKVKHDVIAFCSSITENLDPEVSKFFHFGATSSDIIDSALTLQIKESLEQIITVFESLVKTIYKRASETKELITMGRSHGMYAEPLSFGVKLLGHYSEFARRLRDLKRFYKEELTVQYSGAVGNYTILTPEFEKKAAALLGVNVEPVSTQVIPRDRIAKLVTLNGLTASAIERLATEIRHLHRSEVSELHEGFAKGQKGSSIMPHKKNPISGENLTGIARVLRSHIEIAMQNVVLWHERDISHSSAERLYLPDNLGLLYYAIDRLNTTVERLELDHEVMENRVQDNHAYLSSFYLHQLLEKCDNTREENYELVQKAAFEGMKKNSADIFYKTLKKKLDGKEIQIELPEPSFDEIKNIYMGHVDEIFERAISEYPLPTKGKAESSTEINDDD